MSFGSELMGLWFVLFITRRKKILYYFMLFSKKSRRDTENALEYALKILNSFDDSALYPMEQLAEV